MSELTIRDFSEIVICNRAPIFRKAATTNPSIKPNWCTWCRRFVDDTERCPVELARDRRP